MSLPRRCINYFHVGFLGRHMGRMVCEKLAMGRGSQSMGLIFFSFSIKPQAPNLSCMGKGYSVFKTTVDSLQRIKLLWHRSYRFSNCSVLR